MARTPTILRHRVAFTGRVFHVDHDRVALPSGHTVDMDVVRHRGSVVLVPQPSPGRVVLIRQFRYAINRWIWELPAGSLEAGEAPGKAARRECEEEIGLAPQRLTRLGSYYPTPGFCDERMTFYLCEELRRPAHPRAGDEDEQIEPKTVSIAEAWRMAARSEIVDMKSILGLVLVAQFRRRPRRRFRSRG